MPYKAKNLLTKKILNLSTAVMYTSKKTQTEDCMPQLVLQCQSYSHMTYLINFPVSIPLEISRVFTTV